MSIPHLDWNRGHKAHLWSHPLDLKVSDFPCSAVDLLHQVPRAAGRPPIGIEGATPCQSLRDPYGDPLRQRYGDTPFGISCRKGRGLFTGIQTLRTADPAPPRHQQRYAASSDQTLQHEQRRHWGQDPMQALQRQASYRHL